MKPTDLLKLIPSKVRITRNVSYEVVFIDSFPDSKQVGECRHDKKQIVIKNGESPTETFKTYLHELLHAISLECEGMNLTEKQVGLMEHEVFRVVKLNNVLDVLVKNR
jgi:hypothetical protein